jgi:parallel beta-helix repeat protein
MKGNTVLNNYYGIYLYYSNVNYILGNNVSSNSYVGIYLSNSNNNHIYHNNIIDNVDQAYDDFANNYWDNGYPSGGNYWSDYTGIDLNSTPSQDVPPPDGIGDTPYVIDLDSQDYYPFMNPVNNSMYLYEGWNLISIPLIQSLTNIETVLSSISGSYDAVQWYNISDSTDLWKHNKIGKPFGNDLFELNETMSFWIHITQPGETIFLYDGTQPTSNQTIQLHPGWNLVGYPSLSNHNRTVGLNNLTFDTYVDCIQWYDASSRTWHFMDQDDLFVPGRGYWMHSKVEAEWEVPL